MNTEFDLKSLNQQQIAEVMGVDRTTIRAWAKKGMPYKDNGKTGSYSVAPCLYWIAGRGLFKNLINRGIAPSESATAINYIVLASLTAESDHAEIDRSRIGRTIELANEAGYTKDQALIAIGFAMSTFHAFKTRHFINSRSFEVIG